MMIKQNIIKYIYSMCLCFCIIFPINGYSQSFIDDASIYFMDMDNSLEKSLSFAGPANHCPVIVGILDNIRKQKNFYYNKK